MMYAVYHKDTGELYSTGSEVGPPNELAKRGLVAVKVDSPDPDKAWNPKTLAFDLSAPPSMHTEKVVAAVEADEEFSGLSAENQAITRVLARAFAAIIHPS